MEKFDSQDTLQSNEREAELLQAFSRYNAMLLTMGGHIAADLELNLSELIALEHLRLDGPLTPRTLSQRVRLSSGAMTALIDRLEKRGFVERKPHPDDRRSLLVHYLPQKREVVGRLYAILERLYTEIRTLDEAERAVVSSFLTRMAAAFTEVLDAPQDT